MAGSMAMIRGAAFIQLLAPSLRRMARPMETTRLHRAP